MSISLLVRLSCLFPLKDALEDAQIMGTADMLLMQVDWHHTGFYIQFSPYSYIFKISFISYIWFSVFIMNLPPSVLVGTLISAYKSLLVYSFFAFCDFFNCSFSFFTATARVIVTMEALTAVLKFCLVNVNVALKLNLKEKNHLVSDIHWCLCYLEGYQSVFLLSVIS